MSSSVRWFLNAISLRLTDSIGLPFYIIKELLVAVFCTLGDGRHPFFVSVAAIALNAILNWLFVSKFDLGAQGLVHSTINLPQIIDLRGGN